MPRQRSPQSILMMLDIYKKFKSFKPDIIHLQAHGGLWFFLLLPYLIRNKVINTIHDAVPHLGEEKFRYRFMLRMGLFFSNRFIVHGENIKKIVFDRYGIDRQIIDVVPHGNLNFYKEISDYEIKEKENNVLFFGRLWKYKGLKYLMKAAPIICEKIKNFKVVLAIHGESFENYKSYMHDESIYEVHEKYIPLEEVSRLFKETSLVILPYVEASQSGVLSMAMSYGKPAVCTDVGSLSEAMIDGKTGILVPPKDYKKLALAIIELLENEDLRISMGANALQHSKENFSWQKISKLTYKSYEEVLDD